MKLLEHNQKAADKIIKAIKADIKNILYTSGVGTGKSYVTAYLIEEMFFGKQIAYIIPKLSIADYLRNEAGYNKYNNITFYTYNYFTSKKKCREVFDNCALVICDEAHHVGSELYGKVLVSVMKENRTVTLGLTATPIRDSDKTNVATYFDKTVKGLTNFEAIEHGLMPKFEYLVCSPGLFEKKKDEKLVLDYENSKDLLFDIVKTNNKDKWLCFFSNVKALNQHKKLIKTLFPEHYITTLYSTLDNTEEVLADVREREKCVVLSCNMLLEGLHMDNIDGIILFRELTSLTVFQQILGRACSIGRKESPLVVDCTETATKMMRKLLKIDNSGIGHTKVISGQKAKNILNISLENKRFYDVTDLLWQASSYGEISYNGKTYSSLHTACLDLHLNRQKVKDLCINLDIPPEEAIDILLKEGAVTGVRGTSFEGKNYGTAAAMFKAYGLDPEKSRIKAKKLGLSNTEYLQGVLDGVYEKLPVGEKKRFTVNGVSYKSCRDFALESGISDTTIRSYAKKIGVSLEEAGAYLLKNPVNSTKFVYREVVYPSFRECCRAYKVDDKNVSEKARKYGRTKQEQLDVTLAYKKNTQTEYTLSNGRTYSLSAFIKEFHISKTTVYKMEAEGHTRLEAMELIASKQA